MVPVCRPEVIAALQGSCSSVLCTGILAITLQGEFSRRLSYVFMTCVLSIHSPRSVLEKGTAGGTGSLHRWKARRLDAGSAASALRCCWPLQQSASLSR